MKSHGHKTEQEARRNDGPSRSFWTSIMPPFLQGYVATITHQPWLWLILSFSASTLPSSVSCSFWTCATAYPIGTLSETPMRLRASLHFGFYSNLGVLIWAIAASISLFGWAILMRLGIADRQSRALLLGGLFAAIACLDDLFMLHEHAHLIGVTEKIAFVGYALFILAFVVAIMPVGHKTQWIHLAASLAFLALSTLVDVLFRATAGSVLVEEVFKLTGVALLATYLATLSFSALAGRINGKLSPGSRSL